MEISRLSCLAVALLGSAFVAATALAQSPPENPGIAKIYDHIIIVETPRDTKVDAWFFDAVKDEIDRAARIENSRVALILAIDSPGGRVDYARHLIKEIQVHSENVDLSIFAYVERSALSAAAWIAMSCRGLIVAPTATFGDIQPIVSDYVAYERVPEKILSALVGEVWQTCSVNGAGVAYPRLFVEAMVDPDIEIVMAESARLGTRTYMRAEDFDSLPPSERERFSRRAIGSPGKALTCSGSDLREYGFAVAMAKDQPALRDLLAAPAAVVERRHIQRPTPWEVLLNWRWLLVIAGLCFLIMELKTPGIGVFGVLSLLCFIGFFLAESGWTDRTLVALAMLLIGVFLVVVEVMILPGFGVFGLGGLLLILLSTWVTVGGTEGGPLIPIPNFGDANEKLLFRNWSIMLTASLLGGATISLTFGRFIHRIPFLGNLVLVPPRHVSAPVASASAAAFTATPEVGNIGIVQSDLRPAGIARFGNAKYDVVSVGDFIEAGREVRVTEIAGNRIVVRPVAPGGSNP